MTAPTSEVAALRSELALALESLADMELAFEDQGWRKVGQAADDFTPEGRKRVRDLARTMAVANPLIKNGIAVRTGYIWGKGVQIAVEDDPHTGQDVNAVVQDFLADPDVAASWSGTQAREELERALATDGEKFWRLPTDLRTGKVSVRSTAPDEIREILTDPDNDKRPWFYKRMFTERRVSFGSHRTSTERTVFHPALGFRPDPRQRAAFDAEAAAAGASILWDEPVLHLAVNRVGLRGVGDAYAALPWARGSKEFLEAWLTLTKALAQFAFRATTKGSRVQQLAQRITAASAQELPGNPGGYGATFVGPEGSNLEAIPKTGATIDAESGRPINTMVAAAFQIPVTTLLGDPGATGARAVAETLNEPTQNAMNLRRDLHGEAIRAVLNHVIDSAVRAGTLHGTVTHTGDREVVELPEGDSRLITINWPAYSDMPIDVLVKAVTMADQTDKVPPLVTLRLLLAALDVDDPEEIIDRVTDANGDFIPLDVADTAARARAGDRGDL